MRRTGGAFPLFGVALVGLVTGLLVPGRALAADLRGDYRGFSQSESNPTYHPRMDLRIVSQDEKGRLAGILTRFGDAEVRFPFEGKVQDQWFKGRIFDASFGEVKFAGVVQSVGSREDMGMLVRAHYVLKATDPAGNVDQGETTLLRSFLPPSDCLPPDPCTPLPMDWSGTAVSSLTGQATELVLRITHQEGTSFEGYETVGGINPCTIVGTVGPLSRIESGGVQPLGVEPEPFIVYIGVADLGSVLVAGRLVPPPDDDLTATFLRSFATGAVDLGTLSFMPLPDSPR